MLQISADSHEHTLAHTDTHDMSQCPLPTHREKKSVERKPSSKSLRIESEAAVHSAGENDARGVALGLHRWGCRIFCKLCYMHDVSAHCRLLAEANAGHVLYQGLSLSAYMHDLRVP